MSRIMAHLVAHYPDVERSLAVARGLIRGGAAFLEVQFPFSDPTADGPVIQEACQKALDAGFTTEAGFAFVRQVADEARAAAVDAAVDAADAADATGKARQGDATGRAEGSTGDASPARGVPIFIMTYASLIYARGVKEFMADGVAAGVSGFILPDIPLDYDEGTWAAAEESGAVLMPVTVTSAGPDRLRLLAERSPEYVYVALRRGITGQRTEIGDDNLHFLDQLRSTGAKIMAGFGISGRDQVEALEPHVHAAVVGSAFVKTVSAHAAESPDEIAAAVEAQTRELAGL